MADCVHIIPHMHWDREWYFTTEESRILLVNHMEEILEELETNPDYPCYLLDGQTAVLEDYFAGKPENRRRVADLVKQGRLITGPWYTQTDEMVVGGESIVRNLLYGMKDAREMGASMEIGYLPDSFGQSEKLPQILNGFGITRCVFWRGSSERHGTDKHGFYWKGGSEGKVLVQLLPLGYAIGKYLPADKEKLKARMDKYFPVLERGEVCGHVILPNGHDQMPLQKDIFQVMDRLRELYPDKQFLLSRYEAVFEEMEKNGKLDTVEGELLDGKYMRVHRSIYSSRADLKSANTRIENKIVNELEPLASIAYALGADYHHGLMKALWKELLKNHAHDSIGCCCSDKVHRAIENRFFLAEEKADRLIDYYKRKIADGMAADGGREKLVVYHLLPYKEDRVFEAEIITKRKNFVLTDENGKPLPYEILSKEIVDPGLIDRQIVHYGDYEPFIKYQICARALLPSMGYQAYRIEEGPGQAKPALKKRTDRQMENDYYRITVKPNGTLSIYEKASGKVYEQVLLLEDGSDDGDGYDFSPLEQDFVLTSKGAESQVQIEETKNKSWCNISYSFNIPKNLESRKKHVCNGNLKVECRIVLEKNSPILSVRFQIDNSCCDHRVRVLVPVGVSAAASVADNQFGAIKRPVCDPAMAVWEAQGWDERPDSIYPMLSYVGLDGGKMGVLTNSVREYEVIGENFDTIAVTLFRSVGYLGKENLLRRPGRPSGIKLSTPGSQLLGRQEFTLALVCSGDSLARRAKEYLTPVLSYHKMPYNAMKMNPPGFCAPDSFSLFSLSEKDFVLSALKKAEERKGWIVRGYQVERAVMEVGFEGDERKILEETRLDESGCGVDCGGHREKLMVPENVGKSFYME